MPPIGIVGVVLLLIVVSVVANPRMRAAVLVWLKLREEKTERLASRWIAPRRLETYHRLLSENPSSPSEATLDDGTWSDLDLDAVFSELDHCRSRIGQQFLLRQLRTPTLDRTQLNYLGAAIAGVTADADFASKAQRILSRLDDPRTSHLADLFFGKLPERPLFWWTFPLLTLTALGLIPTMFFWPKAAIVLLAIAAANIAIQLLYRLRVESLIPAIHGIPAFIDASTKLGSLKSELLATERDILAQGVKRLGTLRRTTRWLKYEPSHDVNPIMASLYTYLNLVLLLDVNAFVFTINAARRERDTLQRMFRAFGYIDVVQSVAAWRETLSSWSVPEFTEPAKQLNVVGVVHPLVKNAVANDFIINSSSALITGSNMSGKTTFVRAVGINAILAQSLCTVTAKRWKAPLLRTSSSIGRADSVVEGKSYYLAEVESIRRLIEMKDDGVQHLFLIDELFRGTNTPERVAGAYAVLEYLNRGDDFVIVATHDTELLEMLGNSYAPHHFREEITGDSLTFDFRLRDGQATTRNAIALLELMKYPPEIVARARSVLR